MRFFLIFFLFLTHSIFAKQYEVAGDPHHDAGAVLKNFDANRSPSAVVAGCVHVLTGEYFETHQDLVTSGANPIVISRSFSSKIREVGNLYDLWDLDVGGTLRYLHDTEYSFKLTDRGSSIVFGQGCCNYSVSDSFLTSGVTNIASPYLSGKLHPMNKELFSERGGYFVKTPGGESLHFAKEEKECCRYLLRRLEAPSGCSYAYTYMNEKMGRLRSISAFDRGGNLTGGVFLERDRRKYVGLISDEGKELRYTFKTQKSRHRKQSSSHRRMLSTVECNFSPRVDYSYKYRGEYMAELLVKKTLPDQRFLKISYNKKGRVKSLLAPVGFDSSPIKTHQFSYSKYSCTVSDADQNRKTFRWGSDNRLKSISEFDRKTILYRTEHFIWGKKKTPESSLLKAKTITNCFGKILIAKTFSYDPKGNILEECLAGNLSGKSDVAPKINEDGELVTIDSETFTKRYRYNEDNLVVEEDHGEQIVRYEYYPNTDLISLKTLSDLSGIRQRFYYEYDARGAVILEIIDDGNSINIEDLSGVSERKIQRIRHSSKGHPEEISLYSLDLLSGHECLIQRTVSEFSSFGKLLKESVYDSREEFAYSKEWVYDAFGNVLEETDVEGIKTFYTYDANGNCLTKQTANALHLVVYDYSNRPVRETLETEGESFSKTHLYDKRGLKISSTDIYGNETKFLYDAFGRLTQKTFPKTILEDGTIFKPKEHYTYNLLNHPIIKQNAEGTVTKQSFNIRGLPTRIEDVLGNVEQLIYNLNGTVKEAIDPSGVRTCFTYDFLNRKTSEEKFSASGVSLSKEQWIYNAFHLIEAIDAEGVSTHFRYDGAGRKIAETRLDAETLYFYDSLGRENEKWTLISPGEYRLSVTEYDIKNRVIEERIENACGLCFQKKQYAYDAMGNRSHEILFSDQGPIVTETVYNAHGLPKKVIAPDQSVTLFIYRFDYRDEWGELAPYQQVIDPLGNSVISIKNAYDHLVLEEKKNLYNEKVSKTRYILNALGNILERIDEVILEGAVQRVNKVCFSYDAMGKETALFEAYGEPEQKITRKEYNVLGLLSKLIKPDGVVLHHSYDPLKRLKRLYSSDHTVDLEYCYNGTHQLLEAIDHIQNTVTKRGYSPAGYLAEETLDHGAILKYSYDTIGRLTDFTFPDNSQISYSYNPAFLKEVHRGNQVHRYHHGLSGKITYSELMGNLGENRFEYDDALRPSKIYNPFFSLEASYDGSGNIKTVQTKMESKTSKVDYSYDALRQLKEEKGENTCRYRFDSLGNRHEKEGVSSKFNSLNQLVCQGDISCTYDPNGNLTQKKTEDGVTNYDYDALNRLASVETPTQKVIYRYDGLHRRTKKIIQTASETKEERYLYQGEKECGATDQTGNIHQLRIMGLGCRGDVGASVLLEIEGTSYVPLHDYRGNPILLLDLQGGSIEEYHYNAFGEESSSNKLNPWRFSSKRVDPETGFSYFGNRYYDANFGRWITPDPLWFVDGPNLYSYVRNCPTRFIDPDGLFLDAIFSILKETACAVFEPFLQINLNLEYGESSNFHAALYGGQNKSLDRRSHGIHPNASPTYGPLIIGWINGIGNSCQNSVESLEHVQKMGFDIPIVGVYNASHGIFDFVEALLNLLGVNTRPVDLLHKQWDDYFDYCEANNLVPSLIQICHSQGAILVRNALESYNPERRKNIHVIAVAPAAFIDDEICGSVVHLVGKWDVVPRLDWWGRWRNSDTIVEVERHPDVKWYDILDHSFQSPSYQNHIRASIKKIKNNHSLRK